MRIYLGRVGSYAGPGSARTSIILGAGVCVGRIEEEPVGAPSQVKGDAVVICYAVVLRVADGTKTTIQTRWVCVDQQVAGQDVNIGPVAHRARLVAVGDQVGCMRALD